MSLNIKNERVHELAREAARRTGKSQTSVIEEALERMLAEAGQPGERAARERWMADFLAGVRATTSEDERAETRRIMDEMYDDNGLPQ